LRGKRLPHRSGLSPYQRAADQPSHQNDRDRPTNNIELIAVKKRYNFWHLLLFMSLRSGGFPLKQSNFRLGEILDKLEIT
jgi:hypothetical protein